ncbi:hypothetical protein J8J40_21880, partial [Mycobacterium tuberculosis]|nr:hypothetical protein [Mycobacterium tuberculosis]
MQIARRELFAVAAMGVAASTVAPRGAGAAVNPKVDGTAQVFKVGDFTVAAVHEGVAAGPLRPGFVRNVADADVLAAYTAIGQSQERTVNTFTPLVVATGRNVILF